MQKGEVGSGPGLQPGVRYSAGHSGQQPVEFFIVLVNQVFWDLLDLECDCVVLTGSFILVVPRGRGQSSDRVRWLCT